MDPALAACLLPLLAFDAAPPCSFFEEPGTACRLHGSPERVLAPHKEWVFPYKDTAMHRMNDST